MSALLETRRVSKAFGEFCALEDVSIAVAPGELVSVIGPNGAGKTTLVNLLTGLLEPTAGDVLFRGKSIAGIGPVKLAEQGLARSFQLIAIFPQLSVEELHRHWRREGATRSSDVQRGLTRRLTRKEHGRRYRRHLKVIFALDPQRRELELERKRLDQQRRERARGRTPLTAERAAARVRQPGCARYARRDHCLGKEVLPDRLRGRAHRRE